VKNPKLFETYETYEAGERDFHALTDITLRDLFAMAAMHACVGTPVDKPGEPWEFRDGGDDPADLARLAYVIADAMLLERAPNAG
jgi:hypothetical protein